jgi:hypothetical protein
VKLLVDGSTAQRPGKYPSLDYDMVTISGQTNTLGMPVYLLPLNPANQLCVTASTGGGTLTMPEAPGFSLTFAPGQVTFPGGSKEGCVSVTVVHGDKVPMVPGFGQQPRFIVTIQPAGALFNPPAAITIPNVDGLAARSVTEMYSFDHDIGSFVAIGSGVVSDDGSVIASSKGVGVLKAGWHCGGNPSPGSGTVAQCGDCQHCDGNQCKDNFTTEQCCATALGAAEAVGVVACCNGSMVTCVSPSQFPGSSSSLCSDPSGGSPAQQIDRSCACVHEQTHEGQASCPTSGADKCATNLKVPANQANADECNAYRKQIECLLTGLSGSNCDGACINALLTKLRGPNHDGAGGYQNNANSYVPNCVTDADIQNFLNHLP